MNRKSTSGEKRWPLDLKFKSDIEHEIYKLQARLSSDPDERREIQERIDELRELLSSSPPPQ